MIQTDPLSLVFIGCFVFAAAFLLSTTLLGMGHAHGGMHLHAAGHGAGGHLHLGHAGHAAHTGGVHVAAPAPTSASGHPARVAVPHTNQAGAQQHAQAQPEADGVGHGSSLLRLLGGINLNELLVFLFCFGLLGYVLHNAAHAGAVLTIIVALLAGVGGATGMNALFVRLFGAEAGRLGSDSSQMEGRLATVTLPIRAGGVGEVVFVGENGTRRSLGARSADGSAIPRDAEVVILDYKDGIAQVQAWDSFITETQAHLLNDATPHSETPT
jgi:hypothetical protein